MSEAPPPPHDPYGQQYGPVYPPPGAWPPEPPPPPALRLGDRLGLRLMRRPEPRWGVSLAGLGAGLLLLGTFIWSAGYFASGLHIGVFDDESGGGITASGNSRRFLGAGLFLAVAVLGYVVAIVQRRGPLATAGAVGAAFGVPFAIGFVSLDLGAMFTGDYPINIDAVFLVSILIWLLSYLFVPGMQGRALLLAAALVAFSGYVGFKAAGADTLRSASASAFGGGGGGTPDTSTITAIALIFGLVYYGIAGLLDQRGRSGAAVAFVVAGFNATLAGVLAGAPDLDATGTGVLLLFLGAGLAWYGARAGRRFTTWVWALGFAVGVVLIVVDAASDSYTAAGISLMVVGLVVTVASYAASRAVREAPDVEEPVAAG